MTVAMVPRISLARWRDESGAAVVEFAVAALVLVVMVAMIMEGGRMLWVTYTLQTASASGARYASLRGSDSTAPASEADVRRSVEQNLSGLVPARLQIDVSWPGGNGAGGAVRVSTRYDYDFLFLKLLPASSLRLSSSMEFKILN